MTSKYEQAYEDIRDTAQSTSLAVKEQVASTTSKIETWLSVNPWKNMAMGIAVGFGLRKLLKLFLK